MLASQRVLSSDRWPLAPGPRGQRLVHEKKTRRRRGGAVAATAAGVVRGVWEGGHWSSDEHKSICGGASTPSGDTMRGVASAIQGAALQGASVECVARAPISSRFAAEDYDRLRAWRFVTSSTCRRWCAQLLAGAGRPASAIRLVLMWYAVSQLTNLSQNFSLRPSVERDLARTSEDARLTDRDNAAGCDEFLLLLRAFVCFAIGSPGHAIARPITSSKNDPSAKGRSDLQWAQPCQRRDPCRYD